MGNCGLKPKVLSEAGAPAPEELDTSLEDRKIDAAKTLINLFLQDKAGKTAPVTEDLKTALDEAKSPVTETKAPAGDQKAVKEETVLGKEVIDDATAKETETEEARPEEVRREAQAQ